VLAEALDEKVAAADSGDQAPAPDQGRALGAQPIAPAAAPDESQLWVEAALHYGQIVRELVPERARSHWTDERLQRVGGALAKCATHYGWKWAALLGHPLAQLIGAAVPLAWPIAEPYVVPYLKGAMKGGSPEPSSHDHRPPDLHPPDVPGPTVSGRVKPVE
jgi:hypothetical protein